jgi:hypothetical protein
MEHGGEEREEKGDNDDTVVSQLATELSSQLAVTTTSTKDQPILICDAGFGLPREGRPRKEKILAIARQLVNFLEWQQQESSSSSSSGAAPTSNILARVQVVGCPDEATKSALEQRTKELWKPQSSSLPSHVEFSCQPLEETCQQYEDDDDDEEEVVYLSPDTDDALDPCQAPPNVVVVGLLIDRRIQVNRSKDRATKLNIVVKRWPLEDVLTNMNAKEPLNVDCILEGMQQWWWNYPKMKLSSPKESFCQAVAQAIEHHAQRHPARPVHLPEK